MEDQAEYGRKFNYDAVEKAARDLLVAVGEDPNRAGLLETPRRYAQFWREFIEYNPGNHETTFESVEVDQMVVIKGMRVWSLCEHHLLPFFCDVSIAYLTSKKVLGLSKFGRIAQKHAHKLQLQEKLVNDIALDILRLAETPNVAVVAKGEHLCMTMRGIKMPSQMISSALYGAFREGTAVRAEFMSLVNA
jgi:GTP cyclohydrolase I